MNNRVDYLSDRLVNLRGKHKSVNDVIPPETIANGVSVAAVESKAPAKNSGTVNQAQERRREQTVQLHSDFEQRLIRRQKQADLQAVELEQQLRRLQAVRQSFQQCAAVLHAERFAEGEELTASQLGERFRNLDRTRLEFFQSEAELEMLMNNSAAVTAIEAKTPEPESFSQMLKRGAALALTVGLTVAAAVLIAAAMIYSAWS